MSNISGHGPYSWEHGVRRFWERANVTRGECWPWMGYRDTRGYGQLDINFRRYLTHRFSYMLHNGNEEIPDGICVCHRCDNPPCVNPDHLFLGTRADNLHDMKAKGRAHRPKGEKHPRAKLAHKDVLKIRQRAATYYRGLYSEMAIEYGVSSSAIHGAVKGLTWNL